MVRATEQSLVLRGAILRSCCGGGFGTGDSGRWRCNANVAAIIISNALVQNQMWVKRIKYVNPGMANANLQDRAQCLALGSAL